MKVQHFDKGLLEITTYCNFKCPFCPIDMIDRRFNHMSLDLFQALIDSISKDNITDSLNYIVMGEPYLHPHLIEFLKYAKKK